MKKFSHHSHKITSNQIKNLPKLHLRNLRLMQSLHKKKKLRLKFKIILKLVRRQRRIKPPKNQLMLLLKTHRTMMRKMRR